MTRAKKKPEMKQNRQSGTAGWGSGTFLMENVNGCSVFKLKALLQVLKQVANKHKLKLGLLDLGLELTPGLSVEN